MAGYDFKLLGDLLRDGIYEVPNYQRNYAWERQQLNDLWEDLNNISLESQSKHFTGNIVVRTLGEAIKLGKVFKQFEVIDGQQRLASITILLHCICEKLSKLISEDALMTARNLESEYIQDSSTKVHKLVLNGSDDAFLKDVILKPEAHEMAGRQPTTPSEERLADAKAFFMESLDGMSLDELNQWIQKILNRLLLIRYEVGSEIEAGLVFEAMNDRGKSLTQVDKIKNYLIYLAYRKDDQDLAPIINQAWGEIFKNVMGTDRFDEDDLLRYHWIMLTQESKEYNVHRRLKELYNLRTDDILSKTRQYVNSLKEASYVFKELNNPQSAFSDLNTGYADEIRDYVEGLHRLRNIATFMPLLIASRIVCKELPQQFRDICRACETYAFRVYKVRNRRADTGLSTFHGYANKLFKVRGKTVTRIESTCKEVVDDIYEWIRIWADDEELATYLGEENILWQLEGYEIRYLLYELEKKKCADQDESAIPWADILKATIEHIWPQKPRNYDAWSEKRCEGHRSSVNKVGNLTLTFWNPELSNRDFRDKKNMYAKSNLAIQRELKDVRSWGVTSIRNRTDEIIEFARERWRVFP